MLEGYCTGVLAPAEMEEVARLAAQHPELMQEITQISETLQAYAALGAGPAPDLKKKLFNRLYAEEAGRTFAPLIHHGIAFEEMESWVSAQRLSPPSTIDEVHIQPLEGDPFVTNFLAWVKNGHPEEVHEDYDEYIVVLEGACTMLFGCIPRQFVKGDIIAIPSQVKHTARITSEQPMFALVQRQMLR